MANVVEHRYVAHLDMLGMSALVMRDPDLAWNTLSKLTVAKQERLGLSFERIDTGQVIQDRVHAFTFSDTIVAYSQSDGTADLLAMVLGVGELFYRALYFGIPLRGGIAHGRFMFNLEHNLFAGPALVEAYRLGEDAQWLGLRVDSEVAQRASAIPIRSERGQPIVIPWSVPAKDATPRNSMVIDWVEAHRNNFRVSPPISVADFYSPFSSLFGPFNTVSPDVRAKYEHTAVFINDRLSR
jgi:hypothetical protein